MIAFRGVSKRFGERGEFAVRDVDLEVHAGEILVLLGSSGSGKTTLLRLVNRLIEPTAGRVEVGGTDVAGQDPIELRRRIGYVFQGVGLFPHLDVLENAAMVPRLLGWPRARREARARELLELVGLDPETHGARFPDELSGGQQQRAGVARALAADPEILLMDEPFGALDAITREALQQELLALRARIGKTIMFVTHDILEALTLGDRIAVMHEGRLQQVGTPAELLQAPANAFVHDLFARPAARFRVTPEGPPGAPPA